MCDRGDEQLRGSTEFSVSEKLIRDWRKAEASGKWKGAHRDLRAMGRGAPPKFPELEKVVMSLMMLDR